MGKLRLVFIPEIVATGVAAPLAPAANTTTLSLPASVTYILPLESNATRRASTNGVVAFVIVVVGATLPLALSGKTSTPLVDVMYKFFGSGGGIVEVEEPQPLAIPNALMASNRKLTCATEVRFGRIILLP